MTQPDAIDQLLHTWAAYRDGHRSGAYLSGRRGGAGCLSRPEAGAHMLARIEAVDRIVRNMLTRRQMRLIVARYVYRLDSDRRVAARLRLDRRYVGPAYADMLVQIHKILCIMRCL